MWVLLISAFPSKTCSFTPDAAVQVKHEYAVVKSNQDNNSILDYISEPNTQPCIDNSEPSTSTSEPAQTSFVVKQEPVDDSDNEEVEMAEGVESDTGKAMEHSTNLWISHYSVVVRQVMVR